MGTIIVSQNVSLDGVVEDPTGDEGFAHGGWFDRLVEPDREAWAKVELDEVLRAQALLLGRRSDEWFGTRWNDRAGEWADRLRALPKYIVSSTVDEGVWSSSTVLKGDVVDEVSTLKWELSGDIVVYASRQLVGTLMQHGLVDRLRLIVFPIVLGSGGRLFGETDAATSLRLVETQPVGDGLVCLTYDVVPD